MSESDPQRGKHRSPEPGGDGALSSSGLSSGGLSFSANRRTVLIGAGAIGLIGYASQYRQVLDANPGLTSYFDASDADETFDVVRGDDSLVLRFRLYNMRLVTPGGSAEPYLENIDTSAKAHLIVDFTPQSIGEESSVLTTPETAAAYNPPQPNWFPSPNVRNFRARSLVTPIPTRLAFEVGVPRIRPSLESIPGGPPGLLKWDAHTPVIGPGITADNQDGYSGPQPHQTQIGAPYGLGLAPDGDARWKHNETLITETDLVPGSPPKPKKFTEVWHTRLGVRIDTADGYETFEYPDVTPQARAVKAYTFNRSVPSSSLPDDNGSFVEKPLSTADRQDLVRLMSDHVTSGYTPTPLDARRVILSSAGASLDLHGSWLPPTAQIPGDPASPISLNTWTHRATQGRDHHVVVTYLGYLLPFGHPATLVKLTTRRFESSTADYGASGPHYPSSSNGLPMANLRTEYYIVLRKHELDPNDGSLPFVMLQGRGLPFTRVRINTRATPPAEFRTITQPDGTDTAGARLVLSNGKPFGFSVTGFDHEGRAIDFTLPMVFVNAPSAIVEPSPGTPVPTPTILPGLDGVVRETGLMTRIRDAYNRFDKLPFTDPNYQLSTARLHGQPVAVVPIGTRPSGSSTVRFDSMTFTLNSQDPLGWDSSYDSSVYAAQDRIRSQVLMDHGQARIPSVQTVSPGGTSKVFYPDDYLIAGIGTTDATALFLTVGQQKLDFTQDPSSSGSHPGVVTPNFNVGGISLTRGVIGDNDSGQGVAQYQNNSFDPAAFLSDAKVLGGLELAKILFGGSPISGPTGSGMPELTTSEVFPDGPGGVPDITQAPTLRTELNWSPKVTTGPSDSFPIFIADRHGPTSFRLHVLSERVAGTQKATTEVTGSLKNFTLQLFGDPAFLVLDFNEFSFHSRNGAKPTVVPDISKVTFQGPLAFVEELSHLLSSGDGNGITVTPTQVTAQYSIAVPSIGVGIFALTNLALSIGIDIPFVDKPARVRVGISTRESPFHLSVMIFTGGGFVGLALGADGMEKLEIAFEFGASIGIDVGVASGNLEIMAGIYFSVEKADQGETTTLTGYVKAHGALDFGPVGVALTFCLSLTYVKKGGSNGTGGVSSAYGQVDVHLEVHVLVFSGSIDFTTRKEFAGGKDPGFADTLSLAEYQSYADAFA